MSKFNFKFLSLITEIDKVTYFDQIENMLGYETVKAYFIIHFNKNASSRIE